MAGRPPLSLVLLLDLAAGAGATRVLEVRS